MPSLVFPHAMQASAQAARRRRVGCASTGSRVASPPPPCSRVPRAQPQGYDFPMFTYFGPKPSMRDGWSQTDGGNE